MTDLTKATREILFDAASNGEIQGFDSLLLAARRAEYSAAGEVGQNSQLLEIFDAEDPRHLEARKLAPGLWTRYSELHALVSGLEGGDPDTLGPWLAIPGFNGEPRAADGPPPFVQKLIDADSIFTRPDGLWQLKPEAKIIDIYKAIAAGASNPGTYAEKHFVKANEKRIKRTEVLDRLKRAKG